MSRWTKPRVGGIEGVGDFYGDVEEVFQFGMQARGED
jgi:hypothetical protein